MHFHIIDEYMKLNDVDDDLLEYKKLMSIRMINNDRNHIAQDLQRISVK